jgi:Polysulphide reductase, NrfD
MSGPALRGQLGRWGRRRPGEKPVVPPAQFTSYYGKPVINEPVWAAPDIAGYLFLGGLAGGSSLLAAGADLTGRPQLGRVAKAGAAGAGAASLGLLVHDLGRPARFLHMMRVFKVTSPMSVGSWLLAGYVPACAVAAASALTGRLPRAGALATAGSALLAPFVASYTAALISDTAVPAWHEGYPEMPFIFTGSGALAAGGLGLLAAGADEAAPARNLALLGTAMELAAFTRMERRAGLVAEPYSQGPGGRYVRTGKILAIAGAAGALASGWPRAGQRGGRASGWRGSRRHPAGDPAGRVIAALSGAALIAASAATRWGIFHAGMTSARDPKYTVAPQRQRLAERAKADRGDAGLSDG